MRWSGRRRRDETVAVLPEATGGGPVRKRLASGAMAVACIACVLTVDVLPAGAAQLYWADYANNRIQRSNVDGTAEQTVLGDLPGVTALAVDNLNGAMYWSETSG